MFVIHSVSAGCSSGGGRDVRPAVLTVRPNSRRGQHQHKRTHNKNNEPGRLHNSAVVVAPGARDSDSRANSENNDRVHSAHAATQHRRASIGPGVQSLLPRSPPRLRVRRARVRSGGASASVQRRSVGASMVSSIYGRGEAITPLATTRIMYTIAQRILPKNQSGMQSRGTSRVCITGIKPVQQRPAGYLDPVVEPACIGGG